MASNKIKVYFYQGKFVAGRELNFFQRFYKKIWKFLFNFFYFISNAVLSIFTVPYKFVKLEILNTQISAKRRREILNEKDFKKSLLAFFGVAVLACTVILFLTLTAKGLEVKSLILKYSGFGKNFLEQAKDALVQRDFISAKDNFLLAYDTFSKGQSRLNESGQVINQLLNLVPQKQDSESLLQAAQLISQAGADFIHVQESFSDFKINASGFGSPTKSTSEILKNSEENLNRGLEKILKANELVTAVNIGLFPKENQEQIFELKDKLSALVTATNNFSEILKLAQLILVGDKHFLILFENNNELRASGGFPGTFGSLSVSDGHISKIKVSSIYDLDGQLNDIIKPPLPILNVNDRWFMRDSTWFASWPESAQKLSDFYEKEGSQTPDIIIALTPNVIVDWLKIIGPIKLSKYDVIMDSNNFVSKTQVLTAMDTALPTNEPKQLLADLFPIILDKISQANNEQWQKIVQSLEVNLASKQIVIYSKSNDLQKELEKFNWTGELQNADRDFLSIVSSNLSGTKTDLKIEQQINLTTTINPNGSVTNNLQITRTNSNLPNLDSSKNLSFIRIFVPKGSKLISENGFDQNELKYAPDKHYKTDQDVETWQKNLSQSVSSGTFTGEESGKTFFGNWQNLEGGQSKTIELTYELPFKVDVIDHYSLLLQKQIGAQASNFSLVINYPGRAVEWQNFQAKQNTNFLNSDIILDKDYFLGMVLQK